MESDFPNFTTIDQADFSLENSMREIDPIHDNGQGRKVVPKGQKVQRIKKAVTRGGDGYHMNIISNEGAPDLTRHRQRRGAAEDEIKFPIYEKQKN